MSCDLRDMSDINFYFIFTFIMIIMIIMIIIVIYYYNHDKTVKYYKIITLKMSDRPARASLSLSLS